MSAVEPMRKRAVSREKTLNVAFERLDEHDDRLKGLETIMTDWTVTANKFISALKYWGGAVLGALVAQGMLNPQVANFLKALVAQAGQ